MDAVVGIINNLVDFDEIDGSASSIRNILKAFEDQMTRYVNNSGKRPPFVYPNIVVAKTFMQGNRNSRKHKRFTVRNDHDSGTTIRAEHLVPFESDQDITVEEIRTSVSFPEALVSSTSNGKVFPIIVYLVDSKPVSIYCLLILHFIWFSLSYFVSLSSCFSILNFSNLLYLPYIVYTFNALY